MKRLSNILMDKTNRIHCSVFIHTFRNERAKQGASVDQPDGNSHGLRLVGEWLLFSPFSVQSTFSIFFLKVYVVLLQ